MSVLLDHIPPAGRILIVRLRSLGDCVLTTPAIHLLKSARPDLRIAVMVEERFRDVFTGNPDIAEVLPPAYGAAARFRPHLTINLHGGTRSMWLTLASLARYRAGFVHYLGQPLYNVKLPRAQTVLGIERTVHTAEHVASAMFHLGVPLTREIPRARLFAAPERAERPYAVIHAFASQPDKAWPADRFAEAAQYLADELHLDPVFIGAAGDDLSPFAPYRRMQGASLKQVQGLLGGAALFLGNDSGPAHMAAAFGLPVVVLFGSSDATVWAPWRTTAQAIVAPGGNLRNVAARDVIAAMERLKVQAA